MFERKELAEEEKRLEDMMEQERKEALRSQEKQKEVQKIKKHQFVKTVLEQIKENELQREMQAERVEEVALKYYFLGLRYLCLILLFVEWLTSWNVISLDQIIAGKIIFTNTSQCRESKYN